MAKGTIMKERGELASEEGNVVKEFEAMHEEDFWSSWPREDERGKGERMAKAERRRKRRKEENSRGERRVRNGDGQKKM